MYICCITSREIDSVGRAGLWTELVIKFFNTYTTERVTCFFSPKCRLWLDQIVQRLHWNLFARVRDNDFVVYRQQIGADVCVTNWPNTFIGDIESPPRWNKHGGGDIDISNVLVRVSLSRVVEPHTTLFGFTNTQKDKLDEAELNGEIMLANFKVKWIDCIELNWLELNEGETKEERRPSSVHRAFSMTTDACLKLVLCALDRWMDGWMDRRRINRQTGGWIDVVVVAHFCIE